MNEWVKVAIGAFGFGLGALFLLCCVFFLMLRVLWNSFGHDAVTMLGDAWRSRLSAALRVAPPPLPPLDVPITWQKDQAPAIGQQDPRDLQ